MAKQTETVMVYNIKSGQGMEIPKSHKDNYVGKGYTTTKPKESKES